VSGVRIQPLQKICNVPANWSSLIQSFHLNQSFSNFSGVKFVGTKASYHERIFLRHPSLLQFVHIIWQTTDINLIFFDGISKTHRIWMVNICFACIWIIRIGTAQILQTNQLPCYNLLTWLSFFLFYGWRQKSATLHLINIGAYLFIVYELIFLCLLFCSLFML